MLVGIVAEKNITLLREKCLASVNQVDVLELRIDYLEDIPYENLQDLIVTLPKPVICTLRSERYGGMFSGSFVRQMQILCKLVKLQPAYIDIEHDIPVHFVRELHKQAVQTKLICSYHNFIETPANLIKIYDDMYCHGLFAVYKMVTYAKTSLDALRMLQFVQDNGGCSNVCGMCMGKKGEITRILTPLVGGCFCYGALSEITALEGLLDIDTLLHTYNYRLLNRQTKIYALLGDPITISIGHKYHNKAFRDAGENAVYVKVCVTQNEAEEFFCASKLLPFGGFSITMPLKKKAMRLIDCIDNDARRIRAINTIVNHGGKYIGSNTDGLGAIQVLNDYLSIVGKNIVIIGAGSAARAIVYEAKKRGAVVTVLNRTVEEAQKIAATYECFGAGLDYLDSMENIDVLINATMIGMKPEDNMPVKIGTLGAGVTVLDIVVAETKLLEAAEQQQCQVIPGKEMFYAQADLQLQTWGVVRSKSYE